MALYTSRVICPGCREDLGPVKDHCTACPSCHIDVEEFPHAFLIGSPDENIRAQYLEELIEHFSKRENRGGDYLRELRYVGEQWEWDEFAERIGEIQTRTRPDEDEAVQFVLGLDAML